jgi:ubiquitin-like 1-activating enzyme E1 B
MVFQKVSPPAPFTNLNSGFCIQVFDADIRNLLSMSDMWRSRAPPVPLDFDAILDGNFVLRPEGEKVSQIINGTETSGNTKRHMANGVDQSEVGSVVTEESLNGHGNGNAPSTAAGAGLKDQRRLTLQDNLLLFVSRLVPTFAEPFPKAHQ